MLAALALAASLPALAADPKPADPKPEIQRAPATPQALKAVHTLRQIPEACARLEGEFTGDAAQPYKFAAVRTSPNCQARARFVDFAKAKPSLASGWKLNDEIRVPRADCPAQVAVVQVWRHPASTATPALDAQGRARIYLQQSLQKAEAGKLPPVAMFAAHMHVEGKGCGG
jgi:hypothetical protein